MKSCLQNLVRGDTLLFSSKENKIFYCSTDNEYMYLLSPCDFITHVIDYPKTDCFIKTYATLFSIGYLLETKQVYKILKNFNRKTKSIIV